MAQAQAYERQYDFSERDGDDTNHPQLNAELDAAAQSINQLRENQALLQRDDGALRNGVVTADSLHPSAFDAVLAAVNVAVQMAVDAGQSALASALNAAQSAATAQAAIDIVEAARVATQLNAQSANASAVAAAGSLAAVAASAAAAANSASAASGHAAAAQSSLAGVEAVAVAVAASQVAAAASAGAASGHATAAEGSASGAHASALQSQTYRNDAETFAGLADGSVVAALAHANSAADEAADAAATAASMAATIANLPGRNKILNGHQIIAQRGTSFPAIIDGTYTLDRWVCERLNSSVSTWSQAADAPSPGEFVSSLRVQCTTASGALGANQYEAISQRIEGVNVRDLVGRDFTLSFWVRSSKTGVHCVAFRGSASTYVLEYSVTVANTWQKKVLTVPGGLLLANGNFNSGVGINVRFALLGGTNVRTTQGAWNAGGFLCTANQVNCLDTVGNIFAVTGVQLEAGGVASPFEHRFWQHEYAMCQRYYETSEGAGVLWAGQTFNTAVYYHTNYYKVTKRAAPTVVCSAAAQNGFPSGSPSISAPLLGTFNAVHQANATVNGGYFQYGWTSSAEL